MSDPEKGSSSVHQIPDQEEGIHFTPPLYRQRYSFAVDAIEGDPTLHSLLDIGCGTCQLLAVGKYRNHHLQLAAAVDIVRSELDEACFRLKPLPVEYVVFRRSTPLDIFILHADATKVCPCFRHFDVVTLIEVIEHLYLKDLSDLVEHVFAHIQPRLVIVTTPNADFNVLFSTMICGQFRHADHKFEFTRAQFQCWAQHIVQTYGYRVEFTGLGEAPPQESHRNLGSCTQIALFHRLDSDRGVPLTSKDFSERLSRCDQHELISLIDYPFGTEKAMELHEQVQYILEMYRLMANDSVRFDGVEDEAVSSTVSCRTLLNHPRLSQFNVSLVQLKVLVESMGYRMADDDRIVLPESQYVHSHDEDTDDGSICQVLQTSCSQQNPSKNAGIDRTDLLFIRIVFVIKSMKIPESSL